MSTPEGFCAAWGRLGGFVFRPYPLWVSQREVLVRFREWFGGAAQW